MTDFIGTSGNDVFRGKAHDDTFDLSQGGNDKASGAGGDDTFSFGGALTAADSIDGGAGSDTVILAGDYSAGLVLGATTLVNVEEIDLTGHFNYLLTMNDANVAAGQTMTVNAGDLVASNRFTFDGSHETDGAFSISVLSAKAHLIGGAGSDTFNIGAKLGSGIGDQGTGGDTLTGGGGADHFVFLSLGKAGVRPHEITDLTNDDQIDISNIDADKVKAGDQAFHLVGKFTHHTAQAVLSFDSDTGKTSLLLDVDGDAKADYVVSIDGDHHDFTNFVL